MSMLHDKKRFKILFASRLVIEKGVNILIDTIEAGMLDSQLSSDVVWTICSDGEYSDAILQLVEKYPKNIQYLGKVSPEELASLYREHDILFMPSRFLETF